MYAAVRVLQRRVTDSGAVIKKWMNRETAFQQIRDSLTDPISELVRSANLLDRSAIERLLGIVHQKILSFGVSIRGRTTADIAEDFVYSTYVLGPLTKYYLDKDTEELYVNARNEIYLIENNQRNYLPISFASDDEVFNVLQRISRGAKESTAGESNPVNNTRLADGTRVAWSCLPVSLPSFNMRKHAPPEKIERKYYIDNGTVSEDVLDITVGLMLCNAAGGIIGEGAVGKSTYLKMLSLEMTRIWRRRIIVLERLAELGLRAYFNYHLRPGEYDVLEMETQPGVDIIKLFTNTKQRAAQLLLQAEVLGGEEVENMKMMYRSGHSAGFFTGHFHPDQYIEGLAGLSAEYKKLDNQQLEEQDLRKILNVSIHMEQTKDFPRKVTSLWEYGSQTQKPIVQWHEATNQYEFIRIESPSLKRKAESLAYRFPKYYKLMKKVGLL